MTSPLPSLRVLQLNLNQDVVAAADRLRAAADLVATERPDVVCVQEVRHGPDGWSTARDLADLTGMPVVAAAEHGPHYRGGEYGVAVLSQLPATGKEVLTLPHDELHPRRVAAAHLRAPSGRPLTVASAHLAWGGVREHYRLNEAKAIDAWLDRVTPRGAVTVLAGDFNAVPTSATVRYLTGLDAHEIGATFWTDAWSTAGDGGPGTTSSGTNPWAAATARLVGISEPGLLPDRRIDYVMVRGWAHGQPGCPLSARVVGDRPLSPGGVVPSDHNALVADLFDPPTD